MATPTAAEIEAIRERDSDGGPNLDVQSECDRRSLLLALDRATTEASVRKRRVEIGYDVITDLRSQLNAVTAERDDLLRNREAMSKAAILADEVSASREHDLKEQLDAVTAERDRLLVGHIVARDADKSGCDVRAAYMSVFGGVMACSPELYEFGLGRVASMSCRKLDSQLRIEIRQIQADLRATGDW